VNLLIKLHPSQWNELAPYKEMKEKVNCLKVINDTAERGIALMSTYNKTLAKNEKRKQNVLQVVEDNRKRVKSTTKEALKSYQTI
jgi:hypothetical protein